MQEKKLKKVLLNNTAMELDRIDLLLKKYDAAETSLTEEQELQEYFNSGQVAGRHKAI